MSSHQTSREMLIHIKKMMAQVFNLGEMRNLCFELGIEYEELQSDNTRTSVAIALIEYYNRRNKLTQLLTVLQK